MDAPIFIRLLGVEGINIEPMYYNTLEDRNGEIFGIIDKIQTADVIPSQYAQSNGRITDQDERFESARFRSSETGSRYQKFLRKLMYDIAVVHLSKVPDYTSFL